MPDDLPLPEIEIPEYTSPCDSGKDTDCFDLYNKGTLNKIKLKLFKLLCFLLDLNYIEIINFILFESWKLQ